jgi:uncharacterized protein (DUF2147 family)
VLPSWRHWTARDQVSNECAGQFIEDLVRYFRCENGDIEGQGLCLQTTWDELVIPMKCRLLTGAVAVGSLISGFGTAYAGSSPVGIWMDQNGRGAVEIKACGAKKLCGHIVWVRDRKEQHGCGRRLLGDLRAVGGGEWDHGWIIDPDDRSKYDLALKRLSRTRLQLIGYMGSRMFSRSLVWKRAPSTLRRCDGVKSKSEGVIAAKSTAPTVSLGPKSAPNPERNPMERRVYVALDIQPPQPVLAVRPQHSRYRVRQIGISNRESLSEGAREALDVLSVPVDGGPGPGSSIPVPRQVASNRVCRIMAPFATVAFACRR